MKQNEQFIKSFLQRFTDTLMINGGFLDNPGLFTGEMGLVLFFFRNAHFSRNVLYSDFGYDLIGRIQSRIHNETPVDYKQGITGIGSAFEYLVQKGFIEADTDDILEEFDKRIFFVHNLPDFSLDELLGIGYYAFWRMSGSSVRKESIFNTILPQVVNFMEKKSNNLFPAVSFFKNIVSSDSAFDLHDNSRKLAWFHLCCNCNNNLLSLESDMYSSLFEKFSKRIFKKNFNLGVYNGLAGLGLSLLTELDSDNSWTSLFPIHFLPTLNP